GRRRRSRSHRRTSPRQPPPSQPTSPHITADGYLSLSPDVSSLA
ncbi:hypothetical protein A2U01_0110484, partial [Trifolium medium]|nr:hypothetical protein [Trifolium medium]